MKIQYDAPGIRVFESALFKTTSTVLETPDLILIVDPNWLPEEVMHIRHYVDAIRNNRPLWLLFTHSDYDHIIGYGAFMDAKTIASEAFAIQTDQTAAIEQVKKWDEAYYVERDYPAIYPPVDLVVRQHGQTLKSGTTELLFYPAPGHNNDGLFSLVRWGEHCVWIAGDYLSDVEFPFIYHSSIDYEKTLHLAADIMEQHQPTLLIPGHGSVTDSIKEMAQRKADAIAYIHRLRASLQSNLPFDEEALWKQYHFRKGQEQFHRDNTELVKKELAGLTEKTP